MRTKDIVVGVLVLLGFVILLAVVANIFSSKDRTTSMRFAAGSGKVGIVEVNGVIKDSRKTVLWIDELKKNRDVRSVVIRVDSPGGAVAPSQEMYEAIKTLKKAGKHVIVSMSSVAASGGYYLSVAADTIIANPGTITGSIGVIMQLPVVKKLADKIGIGMETIKSGKMKDVGNMYREMQPEERAYLQSSIDDTYDQFVSAVATGRKMTEAQVRELADGRIYTGRQAKANGLIDLIGTYDDAIKLAARLGSINGEPRLVKAKPAKTGLLALLVGDEDESEQASASLFGKLIPNPMQMGTSGFEYRWVAE